MAELKIKRCVVGMISTNCYIVYKAPQGEENPCIIIDPGDNASYLAKLCRDEKLKPGAILLTHGHFDHMMAADELRRTFQIPIYAGEKEVELLADPDMNVSKLGGECVSLNVDRTFHNQIHIISRIWIIPLNLKPLLGKEFPDFLYSVRLPASHLQVQPDPLHVEPRNGPSPWTYGRNVIFAGRLRNRILPVQGS